MFTSQIEKFGDPNGIVQFTEDALRERVYNESTETEGPFNISLLITRREGVMGNITVRLHEYTVYIYIYILLIIPVSVLKLAEFIQLSLSVKWKHNNAFISGALADTE